MHPFMIDGKLDYSYICIMATKTKKERVKNKKTKRRVTSSLVNKKKSKPSVFKDVMEALEEVRLIEEGKLKGVDAIEWIKSLK